MKKRIGTAGIRTAAVIMITAVMFSLRVFAAETLPAETVQGTENVAEEMTENTSEETKTTPEGTTETTEPVEGSAKAEETGKELPAEEGQNTSNSSVELPVVELPASLEENEENENIEEEDPSQVGEPASTEGNEALTGEPSENTVSEGEEDLGTNPAQEENLTAQRGGAGQETEADSVVEEQVSDEELPIPGAFRVAMDTAADRLHFITLNTNGSSSAATLVESNGLFGLIDTSNPSGDQNSNLYTAYTDANANGITVVNYLKSLDITHLSFVLATHAHSDHTGGMFDIVNNGFVDDTTVYIYKDYYSKNAERTGTSEDSYWHNDYYVDKALQLMRDKNAVLLDTSAPQQSALDMLGAVINHDPSGDSVGDNLSFTMGDFLVKLYNLYKVSESNENLNSIVTTVQKDEARAVLMADMQLAEGMEDRVVDAIVRNDGTARTDVLKVGHHGYSGSTGVHTVETLNPRNAVVSTRSTTAGPENKAYYNYLMGMQGTKIYRTSEAGGALIADFSGNNSVTLWNKDLQKGNNVYLYPIEWRASYSNGWQQWVADSSGSSSYLFINNGKAVTGWANISGSWYFFDSNYLMHKGWLQIGSNTYYTDPSGVMHKGWLQEGGRWYYLDGYGILVKNKTQTIDGSNYTFDANGALHSSWVCINSGWYYLQADGSVTKGWADIGANRYYFNSNGVMQKNMWASVDGKKYYVDGYGIMMKGPGWKQIGGNWYYLQEDGAVTTGLTNIGGNTYYLDASGIMQKNKWVTVDGKQYYLDGYGIAAKGPGWKQVSGSWYYLNADGSAVTGWKEFDNGWYYFNAGGVMQKNTWVPSGDGKRYYLDGYGIMMTGPGWKQIGGSWYYLNAGGDAATGLMTLDGNTYYLDASGVMQKNTWVTVDGKQYYLDGYGIAAKGPGWKQVGSNWYYLETDGSAVTGWKLFGTSWYYFNASGVMQKNTWAPAGDGKRYYLDGYGIMMTGPGWKQIGGKWYYLNAGGDAATGRMELDGNSYYMGTDGAMQTKRWVTVENKRYYLDGYGIMKKGPGWNQIDGSWYYLYADGSAAIGLFTADGITYYTNQTGVMQKNITVTVDGKTYHFDGYGRCDNVY